MRTVLNRLSWLLGSLLLASSALAHGSGFGISVTVVDRQFQHRQIELLASFPVPATALALAAGGDGRTYAYPDNVSQAAAFFGSELPLRGYRLISRTGDGKTVRETWQGDDSRVVLHMQQALGTIPATRIRILASASATQG